ncbi:MAG: large conductance mechanosensitive channel protein MscL [Candidatus Parcubacteria bacterium]|nr:large conductance mechanosensitive channel protein MscL [Candidatus Parcubacteria bacterium]
MFKEFKDFIIHGHTVDLAVGVVVGAAFKDIVYAIVKDILTPIIGMTGEAQDFAGLYFTLHGSRFMYGEFINTTVSAFLIFVALYFFVVKPMNILISLAPGTKKCTECLSSIPLEAKRCSFCGQKQ